MRWVGNGCSMCGGVPTVPCARCRRRRRRRRSMVRWSWLPCTLNSNNIRRSSNDTTTSYPCQTLQQARTVTAVLCRCVCSRSSSGCRVIIMQLRSGPVCRPREIPPIPRAGPPHNSSSSEKRRSKQRGGKRSEEGSGAARFAQYPRAQPARTPPILSAGPHPIPLHRRLCVVRCVPERSSTSRINHRSITGWRSCLVPVTSTSIQR